MATRIAREPATVLPFEEAALVLKALGHPLRLRLACGLCRQPSNLTRIVTALGAPLSTVALHLGVLRRAGILAEERSGAEVRFRVKDQRVGAILRALCRGAGARTDAWDWNNLARTLGHQIKVRPARGLPRKGSRRQA